MAVRVDVVSVQVSEIKEEKSCEPVGRENWVYDFPAATLLIQVRFKLERYKRILEKETELYKNYKDSGPYSAVVDIHYERIIKETRAIELKYEAWITLLSQTPDKIYKLNHADYLYFF